MITFHDMNVADAVKAWESGESVWSVEMGGLGPGYEQAIQILIFELLRAEQGKVLPSESQWQAWGDETISKLDTKLGFSGAQVGVAKQVAYRILRDGYEEALQSAPKDRLIQVNRYFPSLKGEGESNDHLES